MPYKDPEQARLNKKRYYLENKEKFIKKAKEWAEKNPEKRRENWQKFNKKKSTAEYKQTWWDLRYFERKDIERYECESCGSKDQLIIHHKDMNKENNNFDNHQTLCRSCHAKAHGLGKKYWKNL